MCWAAMGPFVLGRVLIVMIPLMDRLGPMMETFRVSGNLGFPEQTHYFCPLCLHHRF